MFRCSNTFGRVGDLGAYVVVDVDFLIDGLCLFLVHDRPFDRCGIGPSCREIRIFDLVCRSSIFFVAIIGVRLGICEPRRRRQSMCFGWRGTAVVKCQLLRVAIGEFNSLIGGHLREDSLHVSEFAVRKLEGSVAPLWSRSFDQSEVSEHSGDRMFSISLAIVPEIENVAVVLQFAQDQVRAVHGWIRYNWNSGHHRGRC